MLVIANKTYQLANDNIPQFKKHLRSNFTLSHMKGGMKGGVVNENVKGCNTRKELQCPLTFPINWKANRTQCFQLSFAVDIMTKPSKSDINET